MSFVAKALNIRKMLFQYRWQGNIKLTIFLSIRRHYRSRRRAPLDKSYHNDSHYYRHVIERQDVDDNAPVGNSVSSRSIWKSFPPSTCTRAYTYRYSCGGKMAGSALYSRPIVCRKMKALTFVYSCKNIRGEMKERSITRQLICLFVAYRLCAGRRRRHGAILPLTSLPENAFIRG